MGPEPQCNETAAPSFAAAAGGGAGGGLLLRGPLLPAPFNRFAEFSLEIFKSF